MKDAAVLLVDDRPENLLALRATLEPLGCRTVEVSSGEEALKALLQDEFAVVLLDVQMPGMDGFETAEMIKQRERTRTIPIIFVTAISKERHHVFRGYEAGAVDYLFKPYDPELLKSKVRVFLELDVKSRAAARSEALLRAAFAYAPFGMARLDFEGRIDEANRAFAELLGHHAPELQDRLLKSLVAEADRHDPEGERDARLLHADGEAIPCRLTYSVARPGGGLAPVRIVQVQDLRAQQRAEFEREQRIREQVARTEAERASESLRALQAVSDAGMGTGPFDDLVADLLNRIADALGADTAAVVLQQHDGNHVVHQIAGGGDGQRWYSVVAGDDAALDPDGPALGERIASTLTMPLAVSGELLGLLHVGTLFERAFTRDDNNLLRLAADRAALAIQRARMQQRDHAITEELQRSLLPAELPEVAGATAAARYFPGGAGERVGGDWYDAVPQSDGRLLVIIGDVAGHGIGAASAMGQLRSALRAYALDGHEPADLLSRLNTFQIGMGVRGMATVALVSVDFQKGCATHASAGHLPPLLVAPNGESQWLEGALGPPLGAIDEPAYKHGEVALEPGATIVLYTDGLVELRGEPLDTGLARLRDAMADAPEGAEAVCDHILTRTLASRDSEDDVTLLVLRTVGERRRRRRERRRPAADEETDTARQLASGTWAYQATRSARVELPRSPRAGGAARRIVAETLAGALVDGELVDVNAILSEVVNNAVVHGDGDGPVTVHLAATPEVLRVEVVNDGESFEPPPPSPGDEPGGFGLGIIETLSSRWGMDFAGGVCVWFEIDRLR